MEKELEMMAVIKDKPEKGYTYKKVKISTDLSPNEVLIKIKSVSFCGTDTHIYRYDHWAETHLNLPLIVGHEFSGEVIKVGIIGVNRDGCFARYIKLPEQNCIVNNGSKNELYLSVQEPLGNAVHTVTHFDVKDKDVVILGCGPIGLMGIDVAKAYGAKKVIAIEVNDYRRKIAKNLEADVIINPLSEDVYEKVLSVTNGRGADVVCDFSGNKRAIELAFKYVKRGGKMSLLGLPNENISIDLSNDVVFKGIEIYGVVGRRIYETWDKVSELVRQDKLHFDKFVTHQFPLKDIEKAAETMEKKNCGKIILFPGDDIDE